MASDYWPLFGLEIHTPRLTLRYLDDELARELVNVAADGIHDPSFMPFTVPWTDLPSPQLEQEAMRFYWRNRADTTPASWRLLCAVIFGGKVIGASDLFATDFVKLRQFETGSWLGSQFQGQGFGKEMRLASLLLGFDGLDAQTAVTSAWHDNAASLGVTRSLGYEPIGESRTLRRGEPDRQLNFAMNRAHWNSICPDDMSLHGADRARDFLAIPFS
jgi:RimJ/RimL family protein N-acetyltransferase